jgi:hypothetical protein
VRGIPLHIWEENFFKKIGSFFGVFIDFDEDTVERKRFDVANLLISTRRMGRIDDWVTVEVMGATFHIWVMEAVVKYGGGSDCREEASVSSKEGGRVWEDEVRRQVEEERVVEESSDGEEEGVDSDDLLKSVHDGTPYVGQLPRSNIGLDGQMGDLDGAFLDSQTNGHFLGEGGTDGQMVERHVASLGEGVNLQDVGGAGEDCEARGKDKVQERETDGGSLLKQIF